MYTHRHKEIEKYYSERVEGKQQVNQVKNVWGALCTILLFVIF